MEEIKNHPETIEDIDFQRKLREAVRKINTLIDDAKRAARKLLFLGGGILKILFDKYKLN